MDPEARDDDPASDDGFLRRVAATSSTRGIESLMLRALSGLDQTRIGAYEVQRRIGAGGMGVVFAARDPRLERDVALKLLRPGSSATHARLLREARALARLAHPNVVAIHEVGTHEGSVFVAMEYVRGRTLREWMQTSPSLDAIADAFAQAAKGLDAAHRERIVHRDFKPDNAIIGDDGRVRVLDFGVASTVGVQDVTTEEAGSPTSVEDGTTAGHVRGTVSYMPPEQRAGDRVGPSADVYAFCVSLYESLHGQRPSLDRGPEALAWRRDLPRALVVAIRRGLDPDPGRRSPRLDELIAVLDRIATRRRRFPSVVLAAVGISVGGLAAAWIAMRPELPATAPGVVAPVLPSTRAADNICPEVAEPDPRSCDELADRLIAPGGDQDWDARCAYRRACAAPDPICPDGTEWNGTLGCALAVCDAGSDETAIARCEGGDVTCCLRSAYLHYETASDGDAAREARIQDELAKACSAGDAHGCLSLATVARKYGGDEASAVAALVTSCQLGSAQACRRIAILPEEREGLRSACTIEPDEHCPALERDPIQLAHYARCRTTAWEVPVLVADDRRPQSEAFDRVGAPLAPAEVQALDRAERRLGEELLREYRALWSEAGGGAEGAAYPLPELATRVDNRIVAQHDALAHNLATQRIADARAGIVPARPSRRESLLDRYYDFQGSLGMRLEDELARELGRERAAELHWQRGGWPEAQVFRLQGRCPD